MNGSHALSARRIEQDGRSSARGLAEGARMRRSFEGLMSADNTHERRLRGSMSGGRERSKGDRGSVYLGSKSNAAGPNHTRALNSMGAIASEQGRVHRATINGMISTSDAAVGLSVEGKCAPRERSSTLLLSPRPKPQANAPRPHGRQRDRVKTEHYEQLDARLRRCVADRTCADARARDREAATRRACTAAPAADRTR